MAEDTTVSVKITSGEKLVVLNIARKDLTWSSLRNYGSNRTLCCEVDLVRLLDSLGPGEITLHLAFEQAELDIWIPDIAQSDRGHAIDKDLVHLFQRFSRTLLRFKYNPEVIKTLSQMASMLTTANAGDQIISINHWLNMLNRMPPQTSGYTHMYEDLPLSDHPTASPDMNVPHYQTPQGDPPSYDYHAVHQPSSSSSRHPREKETYQSSSESHDPACGSMGFTPSHPGAPYYQSSMHPPMPPPPPGPRSVYERFRHHRGAWMARHGMYMAPPPPPPPPPPMPFVFHSPPPPPMASPATHENFYGPMPSYELLKSVQRQMRKEAKRERKHERRQERSERSTHRARGKQPALVQDGYQSSSSSSVLSLSSSFCSVSCPGESSQQSPALSKKNSHVKHPSAEDDLPHDIDNLNLNAVYSKPKD